MSNKKIIIFLLILILGLLAISNVGASKISNDTSDLLSIDNDDSLISVNDDGLMKNNHEGTFKDLADEISKTNDELNLTMNYIYSPGDSEYCNGIVIDKSININGNGFTINGKNQARAFQIDGPDVVLNNCNFVNSPIFWSGANGVLANCSFVNSTPVCGYLNGGAIDWQGINGILSGCSFVNCSAREYGGAIFWGYAGINGVLTDCSFVNCSALDNSEYNYGGAVHWLGDYGVLSNSSFVNCSAECGGAVLWGSQYWDDTVWICGIEGTLTNCSFINCSASEFGGAVHWLGDDSSLSNCDFVNSSAKYGGAVYWGTQLYFEGEMYQLGVKGVLANCSFVNSSAKESGGSVYWGGNQGNMFNCSFKNSSANGYGGGIFCNAKNCKLTYPYFRDCAAQNGSQWYSIYYLHEFVSAVILAPGVNTTYRVSECLNVTFKDVNDKAIVTNYLTLLLNNEYYNKLTDSKGQVSFDIPDDLLPGTYVATISSSRSGKHDAISTTTKVTVNKASVNIVTSCNCNEFVATLINNATGKGIVGANVHVSLNGVDYKIKTNSKGQVKVSTADLPIGTYVAIISYCGSNKYNPSNLTVDAVIKLGSNLSAFYDDEAKELTANLTTAEGIPRVNVNLFVNLDGVDYTLKTDSKGLVKLSTADLAPGRFVAHVSYKGSSKYDSADKTVIVNNKIDSNLSVFYDDEAKELTVTLINAKGSPCVNANIFVSLNGGDYHFKTNSKGQAKLSTANLISGNYTANVSYNGNSKYNPAGTSMNIAVKTGVIIAGIYSDSDKLTATLTDGATGEPLTGVNVKVNIDGRIMTVKSNSNGIITVPTTDLALTVYNVTIYYAGNSKYSPASTATTIDLNKANVIITYVYNANQRELVMTLKNSKTGNAVNSANIVTNLNGVKTTLKSNSKGQIVISTANLSLGTYVGTISYGGNARYNPVSMAFKVNV